jgi:hypothetical protein
MANADHTAQLRKGVAAWNAWRDENPDIAIAEVICPIQTSKSFSPTAESAHQERLAGSITDWFSTMEMGHLYESRQSVSREG